MPEKFFTYKDDTGPLFVSSAVQKGRKGLPCVHPGALSFHSPVGPTVLWLWRLKSTAEDIFSYTELSTTELKHKACPLWWLVSWDPTDSNTCTRNTRIMTALLVGSRTFDSAGFPQPLTHSSFSHYLQIWLYAVIKQGKGTTWLRNCSENSKKAVIYFLSVKCASSAFFILFCLVFSSQMHGSRYYLFCCKKV